MRSMRPTLLLECLNNLMPLIIVGGASLWRVFHDLKYHINEFSNCQISFGFVFVFLKLFQFSVCSLIEVASQLSLYWWC